MQKKSLNLLAYAYAISVFSQGILMPIYAFFVQKIGGGILETAWAIGLFSILTGVATLVLSKTEFSHTHRKEFLCGGWFLWLISVMMYCCISTIKILFLSQILSAFGSALSNPAYAAEYSEQTADDLSGGWGKLEGLMNIFYGIAALVGGYVAVHYGFEILMWCMAFAATISFALIFYYSYNKNRV